MGDDNFGNDYRNNNEESFLEASGNYNGSRDLQLSYMRSARD